MSGLHSVIEHRANYYCWKCQRPATNFHKERRPGAYVASDVCEDCYGSIARSVIDHNKRARKNGKQGSLTTRQWIEILRSSNGCCHYCKQFVGYPNLILEHITPIALGGSTTPQNCIPACNQCNKGKRAKSLEQWRSEVSV